MKTAKNVLFPFVSAVALVLLTSSGAWASTIPFSDLFDPEDVLFSGKSGVACTGTNGVLDTTSALECESMTWTQTLPGYNSLTDTLTSGTLTLTAYNDIDQGNPGQTFSLLVDLLTFNGTVTSSSTQGAPNTFAFTVLSQLADGGVNVTLTSANGNHTFYFAESQLDAEANRATGEGDPLGPAAASIPEPASLLLVGTGAIALARRCRLHRKNL